MDIRTSFALWPIAPFGGEGEEDPPAGDAVTDKDKPDAKKDKAETKTDDKDEEEDDEYAGLTPAELRKIASDNAKAAAKAKADAKVLTDAQEAEERKKNDENTNLKKDVEKLTTENTTLRSTMTKQAIVGAIRDDTRYEFHDPEMVAQQLDPEVVTVDDKGTVTGIKAALPKVVKQHPFLVKKDNTVEDDGKNGKANNNGNNGSGNGNGGPTGSQPGQGGTSGGGGNDVDVKVLAENYPALATPRV
jgi:hypothetical protein